ISGFRQAESGILMIAVQRSLLLLGAGLPGCGPYGNSTGGVPVLPMHPSAGGGPARPVRCRGGTGPAQRKNKLSRVDMNDYADPQQARLDAMAAPLLAWYDVNKRTLPWRGTRDPYQIWVSEVMLQQTRVAAVIPYYQRWMAELPDVAALAA